MTLLRWHDSFVSLGTAKRTKDNPAPHAFGLATEADGTVVVYCRDCDTEGADGTHCCLNNRGIWGEVCNDCAQTDWWLDLCEEAWTRRMENFYG